MSSNGTLLALALGLGGGALAWHFTHDAKMKPTGPAPGASGPRPAAPCAVRLDAAGLTVDGTHADASTAVARCKVNGRADLVVASDAPAGALAQLTAALQAAGVSFTQKVA